MEITTRIKEVANKIVANWEAEHRSRQLIESMAETLAGLPEFQSLPPQRVEMPSVRAIDTRPLALSFRDAAVLAVMPTMIQLALVQMTETGKLPENPDQIKTAVSADAFGWADAMEAERAKREPKAHGCGAEGCDCK